MKFDDFMKKGAAFADSIWNSKRFIPVLLIMSCVFLALKMGMAGMFVLVAVIVLMLLFSDDLLAIVCPTYCMLLVSTQYYTDYSVLTDYMWYAIIPVASAILFHMIYYRRPFVKGKLFYPLIAVSAALILGGVFCISREDYFRPIGLYYVLGLGAAQLFFYCLACSRLQNERSYDRVERLAAIVYAAGLLAVFIVFMFYVDNIDKIIEKGGIIYYKARNYMASVLLMSLPMPCVFIKKSNWHLLSMGAMMAALLLVGSRSGLVFGPIILLACAIYIFCVNKKSRKLYLIIAAVLAIPVIFAAIKWVPDFYARRLVNGKFINSDETRVKFITQGIQDFRNHPIFGIGVASQLNLHIFKGIIPGSLVFYHNFIVQIFASMGLMGVLAYAWNGFERIKLLWKMRKTRLIVYGFSYVAILLMSLTNPGIFCPFPEASLMTLLFAYIENEQNNELNA